MRSSTHCWRQTQELSVLMDEIFKAIDKVGTLKGIE